MRKKEKSSGLTLLEILVSIGLISVISATVAVIIFLLLRSFSKAQSTKEVKENGEAALVFIEKAIRDAVNLEGCTSGSLSVRNSDGEIITFYCDAIGFDQAMIARTLSPSGDTIYLTASSVKCSNFSCSASSFGTHYLVNFSFDLEPVGAYFAGAKATFSSKVFLYKQE